jgi:hypothetical protein
LQTSGLIRYRRGRIQIANRPALEQSACECYAVIKQHSDNLFCSMSGKLTDKKSVAGQYRGDRDRAASAPLQ